MTTITCPKVLLLDEPTAALSPEASELLANAVILLSKQNSLTTLCVTHDSSFAEKIQTTNWNLRRLNDQRSTGVEIDFFPKNRHSFPHVHRCDDKF